MSGQTPVSLVNNSLPAYVESVITLLFQWPARAMAFSGRRSERYCSDADLYSLEDLQNNQRFRKAGMGFGYVLNRDLEHARASLQQELQNSVEMRSAWDMADKILSDKAR